MSNKVKIIISIVLTSVLLFGCTHNTAQNPASEDSSLTSSREVSSQEAEEVQEELTKIEKETYEGERNFVGNFNLTNQQQLQLESMINALNEAGIIADFTSIEDIASEQFPTYLGFRSKYYSDIMLDGKLNAILSYDQALAILKGDFGIDKAPKWLEEQKNETIKSPFSSQGNPAEIQFIDQMGADIVVTSKMFANAIREPSDKDYHCNTVRHLSKLTSDGNLVFVSGRIVD